MNMILFSILKALKKIFSPEVLGKILALTLSGLFLWLAVIFFYWSEMVEWVYRPLYNLGWLQTVMGFFSQIISIFLTVSAEQLSKLVSQFIVLLTLAPIVYVSTLLLSALLLVPLLIRSVIKSDFPDFQKRPSGNMFSNTLITIKSTLIYFVLLILTWPSFFVPGLQLLVPMLLNAYLAKSILTHEILQELADEQEMQKIKSENSFSLFVLGFLTAGLLYIPFINILAPPITVLSYIYFLIGHLQELRNRKNQEIF